MTQATTPTFTLTLPESIDLTEAENVYFTLKQGATAITKTGEDIVVVNNVVEVFVPQADTIKFRSGKAHIQLNWTYSDGARACSEIATISVAPNLEDGVLE